MRDQKHSAAGRAGYSYLAISIHLMAIAWLAPAQVFAQATSPSPRLTRRPLQLILQSKVCAATLAY